VPGVGVVTTSVAFRLAEDWQATSAVAAAKPENANSHLDVECLNLFILRLL